MKKFNILFIIILMFQIAAMAQMKRQDVVWARTIPAGTITLDGILNEPAWAQAESLKIVYGQSAGLPTSGWRAEFQPDAITDPTHATVKFLVQGNQLFIAFDIPDSSIGGNVDWARWDAILMSVKDNLNRDPLTKVAAAKEYFYSWWTNGLTNTTPIVGSKPRFLGFFGNFTDTTRTPEQINAWDAVTVIKGTSNDNLRDTSWVTEMKIDLSVLGYDVTKAEGDLVALHFSIWDCDYLFEGNPGRISTTRTHFQAPWGNAHGSNVARIIARPDIGLTSAIPNVEPDVSVPEIAGANITMDGKLFEPEWNTAYSFNIAWDDSVLRSTYPGAGRLMSGHWQPELIPGLRPPILDPSFGTVKMFFKDNFLYLGADVKDQLIQGTEIYDQIDGAAFIIGHRNSFDAENTMEFKLLRINYNNLGNPAAYDYLPVLQDSLGAEWSMSLKGSSTVNVNSDIDSGYTIELKVDLTKLGYPAGLGDRLLFMGVMLADGDSFDDSTNNYGSRTWWFREHGGAPSAAWMYLSAGGLSVDDNSNYSPSSFKLFGNYPNPFNPSTKIKYAIPSEGNVTLTIYNSLGEEISKIFEQNKIAGVYEHNFTSNNLSSGIYFYKVKFESNYSGTKELTGKMILMK
ncbi:MAG TPA: sugar-binding protein [Ignavibacteriaceae bacterium]|nr:sugar-binding protein [Ignavibacteriaceae bacterium]